MKLIRAFVHHVRASAVVEAMADAGYRNLTLQDVKGMLKPLSEAEQDYSMGAGLVISEVQISLVCEDVEVEAVTAILQAVARVGPHISGWIYVIPVDAALPIGGPEA